MHPAIIIGTVRSLIVDVAMGQIPRSTERISSFVDMFVYKKKQNAKGILDGGSITLIINPKHNTLIGVSEYRT